MSIKKALEFSEWAKRNSDAIKNMTIAEITRLSHSNGFGFAETTVKDMLISLSLEFKRARRPPAALKSNGDATALQELRSELRSEMAAIRQILGEIREQVKGLL